MREASLCRAGAHLDGAWQRIADGTPKAWKCSVGWLANHTKPSDWRIYNRHQGPLLARSCECDAAHGSARRHSADDYTWETRRGRGSCVFPRWDGNRFCAALGSRVILLVGDSTMFQFASTLQALLRASGDGGGSSCAAQIDYALSDTLLGGCLGYFGRGGQWGALVSSSKRWPSIVILAAHAHVYRPPVGKCSPYPPTQHTREEQLAAFEAVLHNVFQSAASLRHLASAGGRPPPAFVWRTAIPGHAECNRSAMSGGPAAVGRATLRTRTSPVVERAGGHGSCDGDDDTSTTSTAVTTGPFNWASFPSMDRLAACAIAANGSRVGLSLLDTSMLYARPDAHPSSHVPTLAPQDHAQDCLHFCTPGPLDETARVLQLMLLSGELDPAPPASERADRGLDK